MPERWSPQAVPRAMWPLALVAALIALAPVPAMPAAAEVAVGSAERGAYVFAAAGCAECHTAKGGKPLAGGRPLKTPFGTYYSPNITPDPATGIGKWSEGDLERALREGIGPDGTHFFPVFPYPSFTFMTDADIRDLYAYLKSVPPVVQANRRHDVDFPFGFRLLMLGWNRLFLKRGPLVPDADRSAEWNRGAYLVRALGHCGECHTPRGVLGQLKLAAALSGSAAGPEGGTVPNLTPDKETGIGSWSEKDITYLLETGQTPDGDDVGDGMRAVVDAGTSKLTPSDRTAIAVYLKSLPPIRHQLRKPKATD
ncbi:MAG TPA: cytochrome c [Alphaproteobacteria bacterium]|nr:cytochrome c [Alphaproteobacteria bacterium]